MSHNAQTDEGEILFSKLFFIVFACYFIHLTLTSKRKPHVSLGINRTYK